MLIGVQCPLLALIGHADLAQRCPLSGESGHQSRLPQCLLLTQSGHSILRNVAALWPLQFTRIQAQSRLRDRRPNVMAVTDEPSRFCQLTRVSGHRGSRSALSMPYEHSNQCPPKPPLCASCSRTMQLARTTSRFGDLPDLYTFECRACGVSHIEAAYIEVARRSLLAGRHPKQAKSASPVVYGKR